MWHWRSFFICFLVLFLALLESNVVGAYFLSSTQTRSGKALVSQPDPDKDDPSYHDRFKNAQEKKKEVKYPFINACHLRLEQIFGKNTPDWWGDWKLWIGLACWLAVWAKWLIHGYEEIYYQRAFFAFGINILILHHLQYAASIQMGMVGVCSALAAQSVFQSCIWFHSEPHAQDDADFEADTLYLDLLLPMEQVLILFIAQLGVWWFYMTSILGNFDFAEVNYLFWVWSYLVMQMTMIFNRGADSVLGNAFPIADVLWIIQTTGSAKWSLVGEDGEKGERFDVSKANIMMRGAMGFFCNSVLREIMAYTIPLMLMGFSEPMDFVVYCVGVNFICTLDDMTERTYIMTSMSPRTEEKLATARSSKDESGDGGKAEANQSEAAQDDQTADAAQPPEDLAGTELS